VKLPRNFSWVIPGQLAGISIPKKREHIEALRALGITLLVTAYHTFLREQGREKKMCGRIYFTKFSFWQILKILFPRPSPFFVLFCYLIISRFDDPLPEAIFEGTGVRNIFFRVENYHGAALEYLIAFIDAADAEIRSGGAVCAHCGGGKGRAGTFISCFMVRYGLGGISFS
jgi:hypothetical protein